MRSGAAVCMHHRGADAHCLSWIGMCWFSTVRCGMCFLICPASFVVVVVVVVTALFAPRRLVDARPPTLSGMHCCLRSRTPPLFSKVLCLALVALRLSLKSEILVSWCFVSIRKHVPRGARLLLSLAGVHGEEPYLRLLVRLGKPTATRHLHRQQQHVIVLHQGQAVSRRLPPGERCNQRRGLPVEGRLPRTTRSKAHGERHSPVCPSPCPALFDGHCTRFR